MIHRFSNLNSNLNQFKKTIIISFFVTIFTIGIFSVKDYGTTNDEYTHRYGKIHETDIKLRSALWTLPVNIPYKPFTEPPQAMPDYCKRTDPIDAYRTYYINEKKRFAKWTKRDVPKWFEAA